MNNVSDAVERHYWKAVNFLVILILVGSGFWGVRRFAPAVFLGKPDLIAVPNEEHSQTKQRKLWHRARPNFSISTPPLRKNSKPSQTSACNGTEDCRLSRAARQVYQRGGSPERQGYRSKNAGEIETFR